MYNVAVVFVLIIVIFFASGDKRFSKVFGSIGLQLVFGLVLAYFSLTNGSFSILLLGCILLTLRYSNIAVLLQPYSNRSPIIKDFYKLLLSIRSATDDDSDYEDYEDEDEDEFYEDHDLDQEPEWDQGQELDLDQDRIWEEQEVPQEHWETASNGTVGTLDLKVEDDELDDIFDD